MSSDQAEWRQGPGPLEALAAHAPAITIAALAGLVLGYLLAVILPEQYEAETSVLLSQPTDLDLPGIGLDTSDPERFLATQQAVARSASVLQLAKDSLGLSETIDDLRDRVTVESPRDTSVLLIRARAGTTESAMELANAVASGLDGLLTTRAADSVTEQQAQLQASLDELDGRLADIDAQLLVSSTADLRRDREVVAGQVRAALERRIDLELKATGLTEMVIVLEASEAATLIFPSTSRFALAGAALFGVAGVGLGWLRLWRDAVGPDAARIEQLLGAPVLAAIVQPARHGDGLPVPAATAPDSPASQAYRRAEAVLHRAMREHGWRSLLVTSAQDGDGKTATAMNLAVAAAANGRRVLLGLWEDGNADKAPGQRVTLDVGGVDLTGLTMGEDMLAEDWAVADIVGAVGDGMVIDGPSLLDSANIVHLAGRVDAVVVVVHDPADVDELAEVGRQLQLLDCPVAGVVRIGNRRR